MFKLWTEPRKQVTWVAGTTQLRDLRHTPPQSGHQPSAMNHGELGWGPLNPSPGKSVYLQAPGLVSTAKICANVDRMPGMGLRGTR